MMERRKEESGLQREVMAPCMKDSFELDEPLLGKSGLWEIGDQSTAVGKTIGSGRSREVA